MAAASSPTPAFFPSRLSGRGWRIFIFYSAVVLLTGLVSMLFADLIWRSGWSTSGFCLMGLFVILFLLTVVGCMHAVFGFAVRLTNGDRRITRLADYQSKSLEGISTALVFPIYNEQIARVCEGLRATFQSLQNTSHLKHFDFFILSDSTDPDKWIEEERRWFDLVRDLDALGRVYYRRRAVNTAQKSGNIRDFLNSWGRRYRYFVVFDADSVMRGQTLVDLVKLMEANPGAGLIQTVPALMNAQSLFGRIQQFANRLYAPVFIAGLNFWAQGFGNYWGHNAILRTEAFMQCCDLPQLPGRKPFGGQILSHDFVEAALLLKENWQVWFACDLPGSYEEAPQTMIDNAARDRRWCQGNLQHAMVIQAAGLRGVSRIHLAMGILGYLASPLWLLFLLTFNWMLWYKNYTGLSDITVRNFTPFIHLTGTEHAFLIFVICMAVLFLPKVLALMDLGLDRRRARAFGGLSGAAAGVLAETAFSTLHAPIQMLWHSKFVLSALFGSDTSWEPQKRVAVGVGWAEAARRHALHTLIGLGWGTAVWRLDHPTFWWFAPVMAGMVLSIPLSVLTSRVSWGARARDSNLFLTPEETDPPPELAGLRARMAALEQAGEAAPGSLDSGLAAAILDPYVNALHASLLRENRLNPAYASALAELGAGGQEIPRLRERLLAEGPEKLLRREKLLILSDAQSLPWLHRQVWLRPAETLSPWWQAAARQYAR
ncbi:MAG: glucans biosynthesis glucosyltransferase MdoH [Verrucomicrobiota bacterium]|jgi:membrane glycosyltransferase